jgi:hypothetical protein
VDSESFHMINPVGSSGQELSIFLVRSWQSPLINQYHAYIYIRICIPIYILLQILIASSY